jgi:hypothetical protein
VEKYGTARQATADNIIRRMRFASWITKATDTHSEYIILIAFPRQQWLAQRVSVLLYTYSASLVRFESNQMCVGETECEDETWMKLAEALVRWLPSAT